MKPKTIENLKKVKTLGDYFNFLQSNFDLKNCRPGKLIKSTIIYQLADFAKSQNIIITEATRRKAVEAENMEIFVNICRENFNTGTQFTPGADLIKRTEALIQLTKMKEIL
jgi:hypothetical protein